MPSAFLPPPPFFRSCGAKCPTPQHPRRRARYVAQNSLDEDFFISVDDLGLSSPKPSTKADNSNLTVAERRTESKRRELSRAAAARQKDDEESLRDQVAAEELTAADLFGIVDASPKKLKKKDQRERQPRRRDPPSLSDSHGNTTAEANGVAKKNGAPRRKPKSDLLPPLESERDTLRPGDLVSHSRHGIGKFRGLERTASRRQSAEEPEASLQEFAVLEYRDGDVYVPLSHLELMKKLSEREAASISRLDVVSCAANYPGTSPRKSRSSYLARRKTRSKIRKQLVNLHGMYAERTTVEREPFVVDEAAENGFASRCEFSLTRDQEVATQQVLDDMSLKRRPMDRLLCGDVGFGKTEVAIRATFRVLNAGKQVAVLAPTTILAQQHYETFRQRFEEFYPEYRIACLTRFVPRKKVLEARRFIEEGEMQIAIGTHMMLNDRFNFSNLGLLIIDEEHRFGVNQKEKIRARYRAVDTLFLSATPIPRTLHLALSGLRDASVLRTAPSGRKPVITRVSPTGSGVVRQAIGREIARGGQVFFVVPRIEGIEASANWIKDLFPDLRVLVAHGSVQDLEKRIWAFAQREYDVLVCTTIIENGINMPEVNTVIVQDAGRFGLAQLHQLRGRVGRSDIQAYAWMLFNHQPGARTQTASDRLKALEKFSDLGSGFAIAQRDMEMRGVGTILGVEQHGNSSVGAEEYARMLSEELEFARTGAPIPVTLPITHSVEVFIPVASLIPEEYIPDFEQKMAAYSYLSNAPTIEALHESARDLESRYGPIPSATQRHVSVLALKIFAKQLGIRRILSERQHVILDWQLEEAAFNLLVSFLTDKQYRTRCEHQVAEERVVLRGLGVCSGDVQLAKLKVFLHCFSRAAAGLKRRTTDGTDETKLVETLYGISSDT